MAEKSITTVLDKIFPLLEEELKTLSGVSTEVRYIRGELEHMQAFLRAADSRDEMEERVQICVKQVKDVAYDTEDVLEEFMLHLAQDGHRDGCLGRVCKMIGWVANLRARHHMASSIKDIKSRIQDISEGSQRYYFSSLEQGLTQSITARPTWHDRREDALLMEEAELVGFEKPIETLIGLLLDGESQCGVISVAGMGGLGKTALVKKFYDHQRVKRQFQSQAWINVSQSFKIEKLLKDFVQQLFNESKQPIPQDLHTKTNVGLKEMIKQFLQQKRYVIVFDDIWSIDAWEAFEYVLPHNNCCSRVLVTTRSHDIASSCKLSSGVGHVYNLEPLDSEKSWTLFCKKVFGGNTCPPHLKQLSESILGRCQGLPLAIVAVGGLLAKGSTRIDDWDIVNQSLGAELNKNDKLKSTMKILSLSYYHLPYHLKHCFLYLGLFPEDYMFKPMGLIRFWIAEGFMEEQAGRTLEEIGENYLNVLISRSLIQVAKINIEGRIKRCRVHDLIREVILLKSKDQNFGTETNEWKTGHLERIRCLSVVKSCDNIPPTKCLSGLRFLMFMKVHKLSNTKFIGGLRLLKVLDLRSVPLEAFPNEFTNLFNLRYLCLRRSKITMLPNSIERLQNLETLDLKHACISELPMGIFKLQKLRHLLVYSYNRKSYVSLEITQGVKVGREIGNLTSLQKLCIIEPKEQCNDGSVMIKELGRLSQLRKLSIRKLRREDGRDLCCSIEKMTKLRSLNVTSIDEEGALDLLSLSSPPPFLQRLYLQGRLEKLLHWIPLLHNLVRIVLRWSNLRNDPLEVLGTLPNLVDLELSEAYDAESLCFKTRGFQRLKSLFLGKLNGLKSVTMEKETMPVLEELIIAGCELLEKIPFGIEQLNLNVLWFADMPDEFLRRLSR